MVLFAQTAAVDSGIDGPGGGVDVHRSLQPREAFEEIVGRVHALAKQIGIPLVHQNHHLEEIRKVTHNGGHSRVVCSAARQQP